MQIGDTILMTKFEHHFSNSVAQGRITSVPPKNHYAVLLLLGSIPKGKINDYSTVKMLEALGWRRKRQPPRKRGRKKQ